MELKNADGHTALSLAAMKGGPRAVRQPLAAGADSCTLLFQDSMTALDIAADRVPASLRTAAKVDLLVEAGADPYGMKTLKA